MTKKDVLLLSAIALLIALFMGLAVHSDLQRNLTLRSYLASSYAAEYGTAKQAEAFKRVFNGREMHFSGYAQTIYEGEAFDQVVIQDQGYYLTLFTLPGEFATATALKGDRLELIGYSLRYYVTRHYE